MLISVSDIQVKNRIRKDFGNIDELAQSINELGLIQPITVTPDCILVAGERRLMAVKKLGRKQIEVNVVQIYDYEEILIREIAENEQRKEFTLSERQEYGRQLEQVEKLKAEERKKSTLKVGDKSPDKDHGPEREIGETRDIIAQKVGLGSGKTYERLKTIVDSGDKELIEKVDQKKIGVHTAYNIVKEKEDKPVEVKPNKQEVKKSSSIIEVDETGFPKMTPIMEPQDDIFSIALFEGIVNQFNCAINPLMYGHEVFKKMPGEEINKYLDYIQGIRERLDMIESQIKRGVELNVGSVKKG